jgi:UDP-N-acetyl-D-galactosamine dehydrogenase
MVIAVAHDEFRALDAGKLRALGKPNCVLFDVKHVLPKDEVDARL